MLCLALFPEVLRQDKFSLIVFFVKMKQKTSYGKKKKKKTQRKSHPWKRNQVMFRDGILHKIWLTEAPGHKMREVTSECILKTKEGRRVGGEKEDILGQSDVEA